MRRLFDLGGLTWTRLVKDFVAQARAQDMMGWAAQLAFYFMLAFFPLMLFLTLLLGYLTQSRVQLRDALIGYLSTVAPVSASQLIATTIEEMSDSKSGGKLSLGLLAALWAASNGMRVLSKALDAAYCVEEKRSWWNERLLALILTVALGALILAALILLLYGSDIAKEVAAYFALSATFTAVWKVAQYPLVLLFVLLAFNAIYHFAPNLKHRRWRWLTPGTIIGVTLWLMISFGLRFYLRQVSTIKTTYGSFGAVITLMLWCYLSGAAILAGGIINSVIARTKQQT